MVGQIVEVVDTREYEERGDRWVPIPGSGNARSCDRCGRLHEVHATVKYADGSTAVVGTGCMGFDKNAARKVANRAGRIARLRAELAATESLWAAVEAAVKAVDALPLPQIVEGMHPELGPTLHCGDRKVYCRRCTTPAHFAERRETLAHSWRRARCVEICAKAGDPGYVRNQLADVRARLAKAEAAE